MPIPRLHKETSLFNRTKTLSASFKVLADSITSLVEGKETYTDPEGNVVTNTFGTVIKQTANNVLIKATESSKTAAEGGAALITSLINVATDGVKIAASKVNIEGAAIFTSGRLSQQTLNNTYDAKGTADTATKRSQRIYYRSSVGSAPNAMPTAWVTATGNKYNSTQSSASGWTTKVPPIASDTGENVSKYPYLWTCEQREQLNGELAYTNVLLDESSTVIDGGRIITGSVTANRLNAQSINSSGLLTVGSFTNEASASILNSNVEGKASARSQTIYKSAAKGTTTMAANTTWVTASGDTQNVWTTKRPTYSQDYPVLFVATQSQTVAQMSTTTCSCTKPTIDTTTTVIDGGSIITNSITADQLDANRINLSGILTIGALTPSTKSDILNDNAISSIKDSMSGFTILWNYSGYSTPNAGEAYICAYDPLTNATSDANGWVTFKGTKRTITKQMANPNNILPYNVPIYIVCRLSSASATSGTNYMVWYSSGWKYAAMPTPTEVGGSWTWNDATDIILGKFVEPSNEGQLTECFVFNPPLTSKHVSTNTTTAASANSAASAAQSSANANMRSSIQLWYTKENSTAPAAPTSHVTTNDASQSGKWNIAVPTYNATYPHYFYCYEYLKGNGTYSWSPVVYDRATTESQSTVRATSSSLANYITSNNGVMSSLQEQIDNSIDIWYGTSEPTSSTIPWPSDDDKALHVGDMYVNTTNGHNFRYTKSGNTYSWTQIPNSDASAALTVANGAQETADGKRTVFTATPTVPYDVGDLWVNGSVVKYSKTKRTSSQSYTASDWVLTATDDTKADAAKTAADNAQTTANSAIKSSVQLWFTKENSTAPSAPTAHVTTNSASTANKWNIAVPTYNATYPHYFYCYEYLKGNNTYSWSPVVYDRATTESQSTVRATSSSLANYITSNDTALSSLQSQVDGSVDIWYGSSDPTSSTAPWPSDDDKELHVGDMYVNTATGKSFRYTKSGSTYAWTEIPDEAASAALSVANSAKTTADKKRRVFTVTPTVPYDVGDLWVNGAQVKYAKTARTTGSYNSSDWALTATDDTVASAAKTAAENAASAASSAQTTADNANNKLVSFRGICTTAAGTAAKTVACAGFALTQGYSVTVYNTTAQTVGGAITLNVNSLGAKAVWVANAATSDTNRLYWSAGSTVTFVYDGTNFRVADNPGSYLGSTCSVAENNGSKVTSVGDCVIFKGTAVSVPMTYANTATSLTLNVSSTSARNIYYGTSTIVPTKTNGFSWLPDTNVIFVFDGKFWKTGNQTFFDGKNIITGTVTADQLAANSVTATQIAADAVTTTKIHAGAITAAKLDVNDINAKHSLTIGALTNEAQQTISDAAKTATNYITYMNQTDGIKVTYNGTNAATQITSDGVDIINSNSVSVAKFGETVRIGKADWSRLEMDYHSMQLVDYAGNTYFHVSDLRDESGFATITETFKGDGSTNLFYVMYRAQYTVSVTDSSHSNVTYTYQELSSGYRYSLSETPSSGATVTIVYKTSVTTTKALTFGSRSGTVGPGSVVLGFYAKASGSYSTAIGSNTKAEGNYSYAEGDRCRSSGETTHSEGRLTKAEGDYSHAEGINTIARGRCSHAEGAGTWAYGDSQHTCGKYNVTDTTSLLIVGKGKDSSRSNAMKLGSDGALWIAGSLTQNSDRRLKTHHAYLGKEASTFMRKLRPALFTKGGERHLGFYAQDVQDAEPENWDTVTVRPDHTDESLDFDPLTLDYTALIAPLTAYAQQLERRVEYLESTVDSLVEANDELREMVDNLIGERL